MHRNLLAECVGTFTLVFGGCGSAVFAAGFPDVGIGLLGVSLAFGLTVLCMAYAVGPISGGHFNPRRHLGADHRWAVRGQKPPALWVAQVVGGVLGALVLYVAVVAANGL